MEQADEGQRVAQLADDTKQFSMIKSKANSKVLQKDLSKLCEWAAKCQMLFSVNRCKMHIGTNPNIRHPQMESEILVMNQDRGIVVVVLA